LSSGDHADLEESRRPKSALSKPVQLDAALVAVVGKDPLPRTELTKSFGSTSGEHELQGSKDKRSIRADEKLLAVFDGKKVVSMFEMTKLVNGHLV
jgi:upstream activation factor subunit UAF30